MALFAIGAYWGMVNHMGYDPMDICDKEKRKVRIHDACSMYSIHDDAVSFLTQFYVFMYVSCRCVIMILFVLRLCGLNL